MATVSNSLNPVRDIHSYTRISIHGEEGDFLHKTNWISLSSAHAQLSKLKDALSICRECVRGHRAMLPAIGQAERGEV